MSEPNGQGRREALCQHFEMTQMSEALKYMEVLRKAGDIYYIGMVAENTESVGKPGVSDKLPDDYSWTKQHRGDGEPDGPKSIMGGRSNG